METKLLCTVVLAKDYRRTVAWYRKTFAMKTRLVVDEGFNWTELQRPGLRIGFAPAKQMGVKLPARRANAVLMHLTTPDTRGLMRRVARAGGKVLFGPKPDTHKGKTYWYGGFADPEGNSVWVADLR